MLTEQAAFVNPVDMVIIMAVALIVFGPSKLPEVGRQLGQVIRELRKLTSELTDSIHNETTEIKSAFNTTSPYALQPKPIDSEPRRSVVEDGYSNNEGQVQVKADSEMASNSELNEDESQMDHAVAALQPPLVIHASDSGDQT